MELAKVWNDNDYPFTQKFKGEVVTVPAHGYVEMPYEEAISFKSKPSPMEFDGMGQQKPQSFKKIRVDGRPDFDNLVVAHKSHLDGSLHPTKDALIAHEQKNAHRMADPDAQAAVAKKPKVNKAEA